MQKIAQEQEGAAASLGLGSGLPCTSAAGSAAPPGLWLLRRHRAAFFWQGKKGNLLSSNQLTLGVAAGNVCSCC